MGVGRQNIEKLLNDYYPGDKCSGAILEELWDVHRAQF